MRPVRFDYRFRQLARGVFRDCSRFIEQAFAGHQGVAGHLA